MESFGGKPPTKMEAFVKEIKRRNRYFNDNSSLAGVGNVISFENTPLVKRLFWLATLLACIYGTFYILSGVLKLYSTDVVSYSVETDYLTWDTPFPSVTLCEGLNENRVKAQFNKKKIPSALLDFGKDVGFYTWRYCKACPGCKVNVSCIEDFVPLISIIRPSCEDFMTDCSYGGNDFSCCERFKPVVTEYGTCYAFNSEWAGDGNMKINRKRRLPTLKFNVLWDFLVRIQSPGDMVSVASDNILDFDQITRGSFFEINLKVEETKSDEAVLSTSPSSRDCLFRDELPNLDKWPFQAYSYGACLTYCRGLQQIRFCNCTYHFLPKMDQVPVCNIEGLKCLYKARDILKKYDVALCECPMDCDGATFHDVGSYIRKPKKDQESRITQGVVKIVQFPSLRVRRRINRDMLGLVVDIGGVAGVFFGASILGLIEIIYIFCIRKYR